MRPCRIPRLCADLLCTQRPEWAALLPQLLEVWHLGFLFVVVHEDQGVFCDMGLGMVLLKILIAVPPPSLTPCLSFGDGDQGIT